MNSNDGINLNFNQYLELEKLAIGAFRPLSGFMNKAEFDSVIESMRLPSGQVFPLPVLLDINAETYDSVKNAKKIPLYYGGEKVGFLYPNDFFGCNRKEAASLIFGTSSDSHPGVRFFYDLEGVFVGGRVELEKRVPSEFAPFELTPDETKEVFAQRGWKKITGFQTRNVPHRAHEYLLRTALELSDGIFIQPLVGRKKAGDYTPAAILQGYSALIANYLPPQRVALGVLSTLMRYAGPREAVFHAIVRRNYGCTHFIVGRDHAGVADWYGLYESQELTKRFDGELGIEIMRLRGPYYCKKCDSIATISSCPHEGTSYAEHISGTDMRRILSGGLRPDPHLMRQEVVDALKWVKCFID